MYECNYCGEPSITSKKQNNAEYACWKCVMRLPGYGRPLELKSKSKYKPFPCGVFPLTPIDGAISFYKDDSDICTHSCLHYDNCGAPICPVDERLSPLDIGSEKAVWYTDEPICKRQSKPRWVKKQKQLQKRTPKKYQGEPITLSTLKQLSKKQELSPERIEQLRKNMEKIRQAKKSTSEYA